MLLPHSNSFMRIDPAVGNNKKPAPKRGRAEKSAVPPRFLPDFCQNKHLVVEPVVCNFAKPHRVNRDNNGSHPRRYLLRCSHLCKPTRWYRCSGGIFAAHAVTWLPPTQVRCDPIEQLLVSINAIHLICVQSSMTLGYCQEIRTICAIYMNIAD